MTEPSGRRWISVEETAVFLSLHRQTVYELIKKRQIPAVKIGGAVRVDLPRLEKWLERRERTR